ncbi:Putative UDP-rhamnose:rhamnosyltransferase 1 [Dendrobium catenatum]|uniref:UDP-rhamnose:rhamnosyltransferase 1 n=1 Tax=Dendrobium catenatum TaxID=906689 RepID=A0A2I0X010_9ASPA|nr:Putative UDP-rhamnose:rhamnosyltransferase 1 [Dendrobium catenatum]
MEGGSLHILMLPWFAFGHLLPFLELAKSLARKSHRISFLSTPRNVARLPAIPPPLTPFINFIEIPLPQIEHLPENVEATIDLPSADLRPYLSKAFDTLEETLSDLIQNKQIASLDCILFDYAAHWVPNIAVKFGVPCAFFSIFNASFLSFFGPPSALMGGAGAWKKAEELTLLPTWIPFPSTIVFRSFEARQLFNGAVPDASGVSEFYRAGKSIQGCQIVLIRSCKELEPECLQLLGHLYEKPIVPVGLLPPSIEEGQHAALDWLDKQGQGSTVYVAFGSEVKLSATEVMEIAVGLELSGLHFVWALRVGSVPAGLVESIKEHGRGLLCMDWVPQIHILAHPSIGGLLSHAGWSSVVEGLAFGLAMVLLPMVFDQGLIARKMVEKGFGVEVPRKEDGSFTGDEIAQSLSPNSHPLKGCLIPFHRNHRRRLLHYYTDVLAASPLNTITLSGLATRYTIVAFVPSPPSTVLGRDKCL